MKTTSIVIVEDHPLVRRGIRGLLQSHGDFRVVGEASNGLEALHIIEQTHPDVVITDIVMPMVDGLDLLRELAKATPRPLLVVLSLFDEERYIQAATECGAAAYVLKQSAPTFLITAIRDALSGRFFCTPPINGRALEEIQERVRRLPMSQPNLLTEDEHLVLQLLGAGCQVEIIQQRLAHQPLSFPVVCQSITLKLGLADPAELRRFAERWAAAQN